MKILHSLLVVAFLYSCSSTPYVPTGEYQWFPIDGRFEADFITPGTPGTFIKSAKNNDEIQAILRNRRLQCRNATTKTHGGAMSILKIDEIVATSSGDWDKVREIKQFQRMQAEIQEDYFDICMEINGFVSKWIEYEVVSD